MKYHDNPCSDCEQAARASYGINIERDALNAERKLATYITNSAQRGGVMLGILERRDALNSEALAQRGAQTRHMRS